ncbi:GDSL-type esterase/lipase family protein [Fusobacterium perfoetens]|uniref:GDSL-type esterase/lipase family protein n=1 Tax=Fusobacterium perfoetens TaxID=852 RepID=UPI000687C5C9|nr:GDSL-type esterase/lipase family protein [Fusobacterium perfoetens]MCI6153014.1 GDSL-type esterase/lipase family protein [Fusobacterium perfoetens]MDY3237411.1 GDSL-type esterase/lipase family protein [Fusobacterium perfoetens]
MEEVIFLGDSITAWNNYPNVKNYGVPGFYSRDVLWLLEDRKDIKGDTVVLMIGVNDILGDIPSEKIFNNLLKIIDILKERFRKIILVSVLPTMYKDKNKKIKNLNFLLRNQMFVEKLMIHNLFLNEEGIIDNKYSADGVHLSPEGYKLLNKKIKEILEG